MGRRSGRHRPHAGLGEQRQGNLRHLRRARPRSSQHHLQSVLRVRELPRPPQLHRRGDGTRIQRISPRAAPGARLAAYVSASGSSGTLAAGDHLKQKLGARIVAVEALECPTLLYNGFGEHNIQGIGDKHVPYIHNVMNTDLVADVSDRDTDTLLVLFNTDEGRKYLVERRGIDADLVDQLANFGLSSLCNMLAAIKTAKYYDLGPDDVVMSRRYRRRRACTAARSTRRTARYFGNRLRRGIGAARPGAARWSPPPPIICSR